jgi:hypothetical protein
VTDRHHFGKIDQPILFTYTENMTLYPTRLYENLKLLEALNAAYYGDEQTEELAISEQHAPFFHKLVEKVWQFQDRDFVESEGTGDYCRH